TAWPAGWRPTSSAIARGGGSCRAGTSTSGSGFISSSSRPGTAPSISSWPPRKRSSWPCITASATCSASSPTWCSTTSPAPTSRALGRPISPSTVTQDNLDMITAGGHGYLVGLKRRRNRNLSRWLAAVDETKWITCPIGITAREKADPPRTRAQEVSSGIEGMRVIIVDSDERRGYEQAMRQKSMERTRQALEKLRERVASGKLKQPEKIGAAVERLLQRNHGYRYYSWNIHQGGFRYFENEESLGSEKGIEGKYVIATSESGLSVLDVVAIYKDLSDLERGFRQLKDVLAMRPIYHQVEQRVKAHIFVAAMALLVQRLLSRRLEEEGINFSAERAMEALETVRLVTFRLGSREERRGVSGGCPDARRVLKALKLAELKPPSPPEGEETVM